MSDVIDRATLREMAEVEVVGLIDALEAAEAANARLEKMVKWLAEKLASEFAFEPGEECCPKVRNDCEYQRNIYERNIYDGEDGEDGIDGEVCINDVSERTKCWREVAEQAAEKAVAND